MNENRRLTIEVVEDELRISIGISTLAFATENYPDELGLWKDGTHLRVTDKQQWAKDVSGALEHDEHDGTTPVHLLLDEAMRKAAEDGSDAVEFVEASDE